MSALARSGKFLRSRMKGFVSSSGSGCGRTPTERCWGCDHLLWWLCGSGRRLWTWFCCSKASGTYWTPPLWLGWPWACEHKFRRGMKEQRSSETVQKIKWLKGRKCLAACISADCGQTSLLITWRTKAAETSGRLEKKKKKPVATLGPIISNGSSSRIKTISSLFPGRNLEATS